MPHKNIYVIVEKEEGSCYGIRFADFPSLFSGSDTLENIHPMCTEALDLYFEGKSDEYIYTLELKNLAQVLADPEFLEARLKGAVVYCVEYYFDSRDIRK